MSDKRRYLREKIDVSANFYIVGGEYGKIEFSGVIANISEVGILIEVKDAKYIEVAKTAEIGSEIRFIGILNQLEAIFLPHPFQGVLLQILLFR